jgi:hypothetical protein
VISAALCSAARLVLCLPVVSQSDGNFRDGMRHGRPMAWQEAAEDEDGRRLSGCKALAVVALSSLPLLAPAAIAELGDE